LSLTKGLDIGDTVLFNDKPYFVKSISKDNPVYKRFIISNNNKEYFLFYIYNYFNSIFETYLMLGKKGIQLPQIFFLDENKNYIITEMPEEKWIPDFKDMDDGERIFINMWL
jgi:hypothetical protein